MAMGTRRRKRSAIDRLLDHSFGLRLLLAFLAALAALGAVNRFEQCRDQDFARGCIWQDAGGVVAIANLEAFSITTAAFLYMLEGGKRRQREMLEAHNVIMVCQQAGLRDAPARNDALERLTSAGLEFKGWDFSGINLDQIQVPGALWSGVNLSHSSLQGSVLRQADLGQANLQMADLTGADLRGTDLTGTNLNGTNLAHVKWDPTTIWPSQAVLQQAKNIPDELQQQ
jgi:hypothetical protein